MLKQDKNIYIICTLLKHQQIMILPLIFVHLNTFSQIFVISVSDGGHCPVFNTVWPHTAALCGPLFYF